MHRTIRRISILVVALLAGTLPGSAAYANPVYNEVTTTAYIWNCPTGAPNCYPGAQTRVGDVRVSEPLTDGCQATFGDRLMSLIFNRTGRVGAAERTGFLYRSTLKYAPGKDSCYTAGNKNSTGPGVPQLLCPYETCGPVYTIPSNSSDYELRDICGLFRGNVDWRLTVAFNKSTRGPVTAGFIQATELDDPYTPQPRDCDRP
jgi:hypothetical protein